jgi:hypothetical protein
MLSQDVCSKTFICHLVEKNIWKACLIKITEKWQTIVAIVAIVRYTKVKTFYIYYIIKIMT